MRKGFILAMSLVLGLLTACGDSESTRPRVDRGAVAGVYQLVSLSFDPQGSLPKVDILSRLSAADQPELALSYIDDTFQLVFRDPESGLVRVAKGRYTIQARQLFLNFEKADDAQRLLLPRRVEFDFDKSSMTLSYAAMTRVSLVRLRELVPEFKTEQLPDQVLGELIIVFELDRR